jgi:hypothetical protein
MTSIKSFFQQQHNLRRHPFATADKPTAQTTGEMRATFWGDFKNFFAKQHRFGRSPFAEMPTSWM